MKNKQWKVYTFWIVLCELVGAVSGLLSMRGMELYNQTAVKPAFTPPGWVFPVVWSILFLLMGISAARVVLTGNEEGNRGLNLFIAQLVVNFFWPLLFFNALAYGLALVWLIALFVLVLATTIEFYRIDKTAAYLLIPYLAWLAFASVLNYSVFQLN